MNVGVMLLHSMRQEKLLNPILKQACLDGKLKAREYANFYDRCCMVNGRYILYQSAYYNPNRCIEDLELTNKARAEIGLKPLKQRKNCRK
ncbi:MAG: hypothetical protein AB8G11_11725 [Saprospiraceae bacterium]